MFSVYCEGSFLLHGTIEIMSWLCNVSNELKTYILNLFEILLEISSFGVLFWLSRVTN